jgi:hypothetical protein
MGFRGSRVQIPPFRLICLTSLIILPMESFNIYLLAVCSGYCCKVESFDKFDKLLGLYKYSTKTVRIQCHHIFAFMYAYCKLESLNMLTKINQSAFKTKLCSKALKAAGDEVLSLKVVFNTKF